MTAAYASLDRLLGMFETRPTQAARLDRLTELLGVATAQLIAEAGGRDHFRHPDAGSASWVIDGDGGDTLHVHEGLVALDALELSFDGGLTYVAVPATDYTLRGDSPWSAEPVPDGEPAFHIRFTGFGGYAGVPPTVRAARLTGARGWPAIPEPLVEGTAQRARQLAYAEAGYSGSLAGGPDQYGAPATTDRFWPQSTYNFLALERERFRGCRL